jgi:hypothetical protein
MEAGEERASQEKELRLLGEGNVSMRKYVTKLRTASVMMTGLSGVRWVRLASFFEQWRGVVEAAAKEVVATAMATDKKQPSLKKAFKQSAIENRLALQHVETGKPKRGLRNVDKGALRPASRPVPAAPVR